MYGIRGEGRQEHGRRHLVCEHVGGESQAQAAQAVAHQHHPLSRRDRLPEKIKQRLRVLPEGVDLVYGPEVGAGGCEVEHGDPVPH